MKTRRRTVRRMGRIGGVAAPLALVLALAAFAATTATGAGAAKAPSKFKAGPALTPESVIEGAKTATARLARSDEDLLERTDATPVNVVVKLDYDSIATYEGDIAGLPATNPRKTGRKLRENRAAVQAYERYVRDRESRILAAIRSRVSGETIRGSLRTVFGGLSMQIPANQAKELLKVDGVVAVQKDELEQPLTDASPQFLGATAVWPSLGGPTKAGEGVIIGVLDTGIWPEHPSFADPGIDPPGETFACEFGDGSDPALGPPFTCNDKLIGAYAFTDTYMAVVGAQPGEFCNNSTGECSARDADGHGTHTSSTAAGGPVEHAPLLGVDRGPVSGVAPGAHIIMYRVCLAGGCFDSDSVAAIGQAITDGVDVINFSISGGADAYSDPVELAFLEAFHAGIAVSASAGNEGPGPGTAHHAGPWTTTVAASTSDRFFVSTLTLTASNGETFTATGASVTDAITAPTDVVQAKDVAGYNDQLCQNPLPPGSVSGKVVVCERGVNARILKSFNVAQGGGVGMILYNPTSLGVNTDSHYVPSVHVEADVTPGLRAFLDGHTGVKATFTAGVKTAVRGDVMGGFSSRGPLGDFLKPDVTAPGLQILAGHTPEPIDPVAGPPGELFQAIAGTSMSSPHAAGVSALVKAAHPDWSPAQIKSALMTSSVQDVVKEDGSTPATPHDRGAGSIRADRAIDPTVTFDETYERYVASAADPLNRVHLNLPSINAPTMSGMLMTRRTLENVSGRTQTFTVETTAPSGTRIDVLPSRFSVQAGRKQTLRIILSAIDAPEGQYFGQITLRPRGDATPAVLPVAFVKQQGAVKLSHVCDPTTFKRKTGSSSCEVQAQNFASTPAEAKILTTGDPRLTFGEVTEPARGSRFGFRWTGTLSPAIAPTVDAITDAGGSSPPGGYLPLSLFGIDPQPGFGDETIANYLVPPFKWGDEIYNRIAIDSNGYVVIGGGDAQDNNCCNPQTLPDPARPNNLLAPMWTDLNPEQGGAIRVGILTDGVNEWLVVEWHDVPVWGTTKAQRAQVWIQLGTEEGVWFTYGAVSNPEPEAAFTVGAENRDGTSGKQLAGLPTAADYVVETSPPTAGGSVTIGYTLTSNVTGSFDSIAVLTSSVTPGATTEKVTLTVTR